MKEETLSQAIAVNVSEEEQILRQMEAQLFRNFQDVVKTADALAQKKLAMLRPNSDGTLPKEDIEYLQELIKDSLYTAQMYQIQFKQGTAQLWQFMQQGLQAELAAKKAAKEVQKPKDGQEGGAV